MICFASLIPRPTTMPFPASAPQQARKLQQVTINLRHGLGLLFSASRKVSLPRSVKIFDSTFRFELKNRE